MSRIRTNLITNRMANGAPTVSNGLVISGVTTSTTFSGSGASLTNLPSAQLTGALPALDGSNLTGLSGVSVANQADNRLITATGTTDALNGEANLTFDGTNLTSTVSGNSGIVVAASGNNAPQIKGQANRSAQNNTLLSMHGVWDGTDVAMIDLQTGPDTTNKDDGQIGFYTRPSGSSMVERLRIDSSGQFALGRTGQITANGNQSTSVFEQLSNNNYPLALHSAQANNRGLAIFYATTGAGNAGDPFIVCTDNTNNKFQVTSDGTITNRGNILPAVNNSKDLGSSSLRWANLYTQDLQLSNEAKKDTGGNSVDGTWGDWTLQEGESDVFMINNRNGKKYMFMLKEVV